MKLSELSSICGLKRALMDSQILIIIINKCTAAFQIRQKKKKRGEKILLFVACPLTRIQSCSSTEALSCQETVILRVHRITCSLGCAGEDVTDADHLLGSFPPEVLGYCTKKPLFIHTNSVKIHWRAPLDSLRCPKVVCFFSPLCIKR